MEKGVHLDDLKEKGHGLLQHLLPLLAGRVEQGLGGRNRRDEIFENVKLDPDVVVGVSVPELGVRLGVGHEGEHDVLDDLEHVWLDQLPRVGVRQRHCGVDVVEGLLHHAGALIQLPPVLVQVLEHGGEVRS